MIGPLRYPARLQGRKTFGLVKRAGNRRITGDLVLPGYRTCWRRGGVVA